MSINLIGHFSIPLVILIPKYYNADQSPPMCNKKNIICEPNELPHCGDKNCPNKHVKK
jgi:hypothetical protein